MAKLLKLRRPSSESKISRGSRTMALARTQYEEDRSNSIVYSTANTVTHSVPELQWAVRALTAEVKLSERERYEEKMTSILVRIIYVLSASIVAVVALLLFTGFGTQGHSAAQSKGAWRPHFTIPILSPFTSIVEHEMSKVGFRTTAVFLIIAGVVAYALVRHRMSH